MHFTFLFKKLTKKTKERNGKDIIKLKFQEISIFKKDPNGLQFQSLVSSFSFTNLKSRT